MHLTTEFTGERMRKLEKSEGAKMRGCGVDEQSSAKSSHLHTFTSSHVKAFTLCVLCGLFLLLAPLMTGCASTGYVDTIKSDAEIQRINDRKEMADLKTSVDNLSHDIASLKEQSVTALKEGQTSLLSQVSDLSKAIQVLEGRFDENKYSSDKTIKDMLAEKDLQQARIAALENDVKELKAKGVQQAPPAEAVPAATEGTAVPAGEQKKASSATDYTTAQKLYDDAQIDFKGKHYEEAKQKFEKFTTDFPRHTLTPNAYFWIGRNLLRG